MSDLHTSTILDYFMESEEEVFRLDVKTNPTAVKRQALWAGIKPGMRVLDAGCGSGKTTAVLHSLVEPNGSVIGIDFSKNRIEYAKAHYEKQGITFLLGDIRNPLDYLGMFDVVWVRFVLEYYRSNAFEIVKNLSRIVKPGGILCLIDLDHNCLNFFGLSERLEKTIQGIIHTLMERFNFDPYAGRKLYSYLFDLGYESIDVHVEAHHLIYGKISNADAYNWTLKLLTIGKKIQFDLSDYGNGYEAFLKEAITFLTDPRRFIYTPVIMAKGLKPSSGNTV